MKPPAMQSIHPIVCEQEAQPPHEQHAIVDDGTPEQYLAYHLKAHKPSPLCLRPLCSGLLVQLCYGILSVGSTSGKLRHLLWSGNSTDLLFVLLGFHKMMFSLKRIGGKNTSHDYGNSTRVRS